MSLSSRWTIPGRSTVSPTASAARSAYRGEQPGDQGVARVPGSGVDDHAGGLVDDDDILVDIDDPELDRRGRDGDLRGSRCDLGEVDRDDLAEGDSGRERTRLAARRAGRFPALMSLPTSGRVHRPVRSARARSIRSPTSGAGDLEGRHCGTASGDAGAAVGAEEEDDEQGGIRTPPTRRRR